MNDTSLPIVKAFVLCEAIMDHAPNPEQKDLLGAGFNIIWSAGDFPIKRSFCAYAELAELPVIGVLKLALMRADSGRRVFFQAVTVVADPLQTSIVTYQVEECPFPSRGVYFVELWYDKFWLVDQRVEVF